MATRDNFENIKNDLERLIENGLLFHAYLFFGEDEEEILNFSNKLANFLENDIFEEPNRFLNDFLTIKKNENGNIGIDEVRGLQKFLYDKPVASKKRTAIVFGAENMTDEAQSAILKLIEEPPQRALVVLISRNDDLLLPTIISRVHRIYFSQAQIVKKRKNAARTGRDTEIDAEEELENEIIKLKKNLINNSGIIGEMLNRLKLIRQFNLNKKLQLRYINKIKK